jgi:flagellar hook-length control protein FliK
MARTAIAEGQKDEGTGNAPSGASEADSHVELVSATGTGHLLGSAGTGLGQRAGHRKTLQSIADGVLGPAPAGVNAPVAADLSTSIATGLRTPVAAGEGATTPSARTASSPAVGTAQSLRTASTADATVTGAAVTISQTLQSVGDDAQSTTGVAVTMSPPGSAGTTAGQPEPQIATPKPQHAQNMAPATASDASTAGQTSDPGTETRASQDAQPVANATSPSGDPSSAAAITDTTTSSSSGTSAPLRTGAPLPRIDVVAIGAHDPEAWKTAGQIDAARKHATTAIEASPQRAVGNAASTSSAATHGSAAAGSVTSLSAASTPTEQAALPNAPSPAASYGSTMQQAIETIHATVALASRQGAAQAQISLEPAELGAVRIHLTQTNEGLIARVSAQTAAGAQAIASGQGELHRTLSSLGVSLLRLDIGSFSQQEARSGGQTPERSVPRQTRSDSALAGAEEPLESATGRTVALSLRSGLIDVLA